MFTIYAASVEKTRMGEQMEALFGYKRADGRFGIRNHLLVIPTVVCANVVVDHLIRRFGDRIVGVSHPYGCTFDYVSNNELCDTLVGFSTNPNVGAVLLVSLGCETVDYNSVFERIKAINPLTAHVVIQDSGGIQKTVAKAIPVIEDFIEQMRKIERAPMSLSDLIVGTQCGASDSYSGLTANPALGMCIDKVIDAGGTGILAELTEFMGAEEEVYARCVDQKTRDKLAMYLAETERNLERVGTSDLNDIAPGNIAGGLTTLEEKSLGCIRKGGQTPVVEVVAHGQKPTRHGLVIMETSGQDIESLVAIAAGGSQVTFFTTGRGSPTGSPIMPVIKVSSNTEMAERLEDIIDLNAGTILDDEESLSDVAERMCELLVEVVNGKETKAEINGSREFAIRRCGVGLCLL